MKKYIGDKKFYYMVLVIAIPIMLQNGITNLVGLLDNMMIGWIGNEQMSGVSIINQFLFVFNLCIFGAASGASIYGAQFYGNGDYEGFREAFRFKIYVSILILIAGTIVLLQFSEPLIMSFLKGEALEGNGDPQAIYQYAMDYLRVIIFSLLPFALVQVYASSLRETGRTMVPMIAGIVSVFVNLALNWVLIFGKCGFPKLGVQGGAAATVCARFVELLIVVVYTHAKKFSFMTGLYATCRISFVTAKKIFVKGLPLFVNEALWSAGITKLNQCYSVKSLLAVPALNINSNIYNLSNIAFIALGSALSVLVGQQLGAGEFERAKDTARKLTVFNVVLCGLIGILMAAAAGVFPTWYHANGEVAKLAASIIRISSLYLPLHAYLHSTYFTLRAGGRTFITFLFDSVYVWLVSMPTALLLVYVSDLPLLTIYLIVQTVDIMKGVIGFILVRKGIWVQKLV